MPAKYLFLRLLKKKPRHITQNTVTHYVYWFGCTGGVAIVAYIIASAIPVFGDLVSLSKFMKTYVLSVRSMLIQCSRRPLRHPDVLPANGFDVALRQLGRGQEGPVAEVDLHGLLQRLRRAVRNVPNDCGHVRVPGWRHQLVQGVGRQRGMVVQRQLEFCLIRVDKGRKDVHPRGL